MSHPLTHIVIGGGAAGFFGAITCSENFPTHRVMILEKTRQLLSKVRISGGGRCNVTHSCFDPAQLVKNYPRGSQELRGPFTRFQPSDTVQWFEKRGVKLKTEEDGRMFPLSDQSETIVNCLVNEAKNKKVEILLEHAVQNITQLSSGRFQLDLRNGQMECDRLLIATGSAPTFFSFLEKLGHSIVPPVPSLFTFNIPQSPFLDLAGISKSCVTVKLPDIGFEQTGPILLTHWGISGPAVLKLSAWAARQLHALNYQTKVIINWIPEFTENDLRQLLESYKKKFASSQIGSESYFSLPKQLWKRLLKMAEISDDSRWSTLSNKQICSLILSLRSTTLQIEGKTTYKQEFVTCGGVALEEINFKTMESRLCKGLFFAGEVLNIDGITGGFNFQNAWTTGWIAGYAMGN